MCSIITVSYSIHLYDNNKLSAYNYLIAGPTVESTMRVSILSSRDTLSNIVLTLSFNVTFGPPSRIYCVYTRIKYFMTAPVLFFDVRDHPKLSHEVISSYYGSVSQPDMTRVSVEVEQPFKEARTYECEVTVEGRVNIDSGTYTRDDKGSGITNVMITGE